MAIRMYREANRFTDLIRLVSTYRYASLWNVFRIASVVLVVHYIYLFGC